MLIALSKRRHRLQLQRRSLQTHFSFCHLPCSLTQQYLLLLLLHRQFSRRNALLLRALAALPRALPRVRRQGRHLTETGENVTSSFLRRSSPCFAHLVRHGHCYESKHAMIRPKGMTVCRGVVGWMDWGREGGRGFINTQRMNIGREGCNTTSAANVQVPQIRQPNAGHSCRHPQPLPPASASFFRDQVAVGRAGA